MAVDGALGRAHSYLYVPGIRPDLMVKSATYSPDAIIIDLEDAVLETAKDEALARTRTHLEFSTPGPQQWVRLDGLRLEQQITALAGLPGLTGFVLPKATLQALAVADGVLTEIEKTASAPAGRPLPVIGLLESAEGIIQAPELAESPRLLRFGIGEADLLADLGMDAGIDRAELWPIRLQVVAASAARRKAAPIAPVHLSIRDLTGLRSSTDEFRRRGFRARTAVHPGQVSTINEAFAPTHDDIAAARRTLALFESARESGQAVAVDSDGSFIDEAIVRSSREVLERAEGGFSARRPGS